MRSEKNSGLHCSHGLKQAVKERYCGCWDSFEDYATQLVEDICLMDGWPEEAKRYFNWKSWIQDLEYEYTVTNAPDGGVFIYRSL